jgi:hypothetical protein
VKLSLSDREKLFIVGRAAAAGAATFGAGAVVALASPALAVAAVASTAVFIGVVELGRVKRELIRRFGEVDDDLGQIQPLLELAARISPRRPLPPLRGYAIAPDCALLLAELVAERKPQLVVETGSGVSTLVTAYALEKLGRGRVVALEHDPRYAEETRAEIARHGLQHYATVRDAPLEAVAIDGGEYKWHSLRAIEDLEKIDLVVDDGPPRYVGKLARYPSLPTFSKRLSDRGVFLLDVVGEEEETILAAWRQRHPEFVQKALATRKGNVLIERARSRANDNSRHAVDAASVAC